MLGKKRLRHRGSFLNMQSGTGFEFACLCMADKFNVATCWHLELSTLSLLHISFNTHSSNRFSCPIQFCHSKRALGLALRILGRCLRKHRKTLVSSVYLCLLCREGFPRQTCKNHLRRKQGTGVPTSPKTRMINGVLLLVFPCPNA